MSAWEENFLPMFTCAEDYSCVQLPRTSTRKTDRFALNDWCLPVLDVSLSLRVFLLN